MGRLFGTSEYSGATFIQRSIDAPYHIEVGVRLNFDLHQNSQRKIGSKRENVKRPLLEMSKVGKSCFVLVSEVNLAVNQIDYKGFLLFGFVTFFRSRLAFQSSIFFRNSSTILILSQYSQYSIQRTPINGTNSFCRNIIKRFCINSPHTQYRERNLGKELILRQK